MPQPAFDESTIDDSEWEDLIGESGNSSADDAVTFKRIPSKAILTSQRSLISLMLERAKDLSNCGSHSTPAIPPFPQALQDHSNMSIISSPNDYDNGLEIRICSRLTYLNITESPRSSAQSIMINPQDAHPNRVKIRAVAPPLEMYA